MFISRNSNGQGLNKSISSSFLNTKVMSSSVSTGIVGKKKKGAYKKPSKLPSGDILTDSSKNQWIIQSSIGSGGFGEIYTATSTTAKSSQNYVIKIEPSENGPLFCEKTVYIRIGKDEDVQEYLKAKHLQSIGMPRFYGSGVHTLNGKKFRFLVLERYGTDLWTIFLKEHRIFPPATVFKVATQVLDVLEYIHSKGYVHADIKGANLLLGKTKGTENKVYLVDFGLAARYTNQYKPDPRRAHNGTIEYTSRDGHEGIVTRRGDIEMLGYNMLQWVSSNLPWDETKNLTEVQEKKNKYLRDIKLLMQTCFKNKSVPKGIEKYFEYLVKMQPLAEPEYNKLRQTMKEAIALTGDVSSKLEFSMPKNNLKTKAKKSTSPVAPKLRKVNNGTVRRGRSGSTHVSDQTIDISSGSSSEDDLIDSTPEKIVKRSWKDCPSVVACAAVPLKDDTSLRRSKRNK